MVLTHESQPLSRQYDYEDRSVITLDFGPETDPSLDIVDNTAIVVTGDQQHEIDLTGDVVEAFNRNGIITIEVDQ